MKTLAEIIASIKSLKSITSDADVAVLLGIKPKTLATAKARNSIPFSELASFCNRESISLNWLLAGVGGPNLSSGASSAGIKVEADFKNAGGTFKEPQAEYSDFVIVPSVSGEIGSDGMLLPADSIDMQVSFRRDWINRKGDPAKMSIIRVQGDSMEPTLISGDIVLVDHNRDNIDPWGGIYALVADNRIIIKRLQALPHLGKIKIVSDNPKYDSYEVAPGQVIINGKVIWFGRDIER